MSASFDSIEKCIEEICRKKDKKKEKTSDFNIASWLDSQSSKAYQISTVTHIQKYSNSAAEGTNILVKAKSNETDHQIRYVSTDTLHKVYEDVAGNAAALGMAPLLQTQVKGVPFLDWIAQDDISILTSYASNEEQSKKWLNGFKKIFRSHPPRSDTLAKQIYFPVEGDKYHLLAPLYSSSLAQALYEEVIKVREEKMKEARECKKKGQYSPEVVVSYPDLAIQKFGGSKPQNISYLNSCRRGQAYLLKSVPPIWKSVQQPPMRKNAFWRAYGRSVYQLMGEFIEFLIAIELKDSTKAIRDRRAAYVSLLVDELIFKAVEIQSLEAGWSQHSEIALSEQLWLDPRRDGFKEQRQNGDWMDEVADRFATWLIQEIESKSKLNLADTHHAYLKDECLKTLREVE